MLLSSCFCKIVVADHLCLFNTLRPRQNGRLFADDTFKRIFLNENIRISIKIPLKFVPQGLINNIPSLVLIMAWRRLGDKPLSEPMMVRSLTHICVTRPQWVNDKTFIHRNGTGSQNPFSCKTSTCLSQMVSGLILGLLPANERRRYFVTTFLIGWAQT